MWINLILMPCIFVIFLGIPLTGVLVLTENTFLLPGELYSRDRRGQLCTLDILSRNLLWGTPAPAQYVP